MATWLQSVDACRFDIYGIDVMVDAVRTGNRNFIKHCITSGLFALGLPLIDAKTLINEIYFHESDLWLSEAVAMFFDSSLLSPVQRYCSCGILYVKKSTNGKFTRIHNSVCDIFVYMVNNRAAYKRHRMIHEGYQYYLTHFRPAKINQIKEMMADNYLIPDLWNLVCEYY